MSKVQKAIDWIFSGHGRSQYAAAKKFDIDQSCISTTMKKQRVDEMAFNEIGAKKLAEIDAWFGGNPNASQNTAALHFGIPVNTLRAAYRGQDVAARKLRLSAGPAPDPIAEMREKCAQIAEQVGGEHGAAVAAAIRSVEV